MSAPSRFARGPVASPTDCGAITADDLMALAKSRRSVRRYDGRPVERALVERLCEAALWAPSNWNGQPWQFVVVDEPEALARVLALLDERTDALAQSCGSDLRVARFVEHCRRYFGVLHEASVLVLMCYKPVGRVIEEAIAEHLGETAAVGAWNPNLLSLGMAAQNLLLAAHAAGLGACFHSGPVVFLRTGLHGLLGLPPRLELAGVITLGWPATDSDAPSPARKPLDHVLRFGGTRRT